MKNVVRLIVLLSILVANGRGHSSALPHGHPHTDKVGFLSIAAAFVIIGAIIWAAKRRFTKTSALNRARR